jgi:cellulose synthase/poly-beta-1,6-N-acetylglucosamine synthase-like glycosyltransferase
VKDPTPSIPERWHPHDPCTASCVLAQRQTRWYLALVAVVLVCIAWDYKVALTILNFTVCAFYISVVVQKFFCIALSLIRSPEIRVSREELELLDCSDLPVIDILVPLYREDNIASSIVSALKRLDYPEDRLNILLLVEQDDHATVAACRDAELGAGMRIVEVPPGKPRTKPRACNFGLQAARGEFLVIYDAEDRPDPDQLKKAVVAFRSLPGSVACLQCKLNYYNTDQNWLTRFFTLEYAIWFDLFLPGLHRMNVVIPLGGTSNVFRVSALRELGGWDPYNVTEDCDLGVRIGRRGWRTLTLDSTTWEEANSQLWNWIRQRSRWVKGYAQTHLVHARFKRRLVFDLGLWKLLNFFLVVAGLVITLLMNPAYWIIGGAWLVFRWQLVYFDFADPAGLTFTAWSKVSWVFYSATIVLLTANFIFIFAAVGACFKRRLWRLIPYALLSPLYWLLISIGAWKGVLQLVTRPFFWEKTRHGLGKP